MSTFDPPPPPEGSDRAWPTTGPPPGGAGPRTAALALWITGAVQLALFSCCTLALVAAGAVPADQFREQLTGSVPPEQLDQIVAAQPVLLVAAAVIAALLVLPAFVLLFLGFKVREGGPTAIKVALVIAIVEAVIIGLGVLYFIAGALLMGDVVGAAVYGLLLGAFLALLIWSIVSLLRARRSTRTLTVDDDEPWNSHLTP